MASLKEIREDLERVGIGSPQTKVGRLLEVVWIACALLLVPPSCGALPDNPRDQAICAVAAVIAAAPFLWLLGKHIFKGE